MTGGIEDLAGKRAVTPVYSSYRVEVSHDAGSVLLLTRRPSGRAQRVWVTPATALSIANALTVAARKADYLERNPM